MNSHRVQGYKSIRAQEQRELIADYWVAREGQRHREKKSKRFTAEIAEDAERINYEVARKVFMHGLNGIDTDYQIRAKVQRWGR